MRMSLRLCLFASAFLAILTFSCKKSVETVDETDYQKDRLVELMMPLQPGKFITYRIDSTVFVDFGKTIEIHSYLVKHIVDSPVTDNLGHAGYRIFRFITDTLASAPWTPNGSYFITIQDDHVEVVEDNLRVVKLHVPVRDGNKWNGNTFLPDDPYGSFYNFDNDNNMADWEFYFDGEPQSTVAIEGHVYNDVYTVFEIDDIDPVTSPSDYGSETVSKEMYSKNTGLVYRELTLWEQQPNPSGNPPNVTYDPFKTGFGIRMWMVDHN